MSHPERIVVASTETFRMKHSRMKKNAGISLMPFASKNDPLLQLGTIFLTKIAVSPGKLFGAMQKPDCASVTDRTRTVEKPGCH